MSNSVAEPITLFRGTPVYATAGSLEVSKTGGKYDAGFIDNFAIITSGVEALGHNMWVDDVFLNEVAHALASAPSGIKSRYTHPSMSGNSLSKGLGRVTIKGVTDGKLLGRIDFWKSAHKTPEGDLADHVLTLAAEDPEAFGSSIAFSQNKEAMEEFSSETEGQSPDANNVNNYPHVRLGKLRFVDMVADPAANPDGLFHRDEVFKEAERHIEYALGLSKEKPEGSTFGVDAERLFGFVSRFLNTRGLSIVKLNLNDVADSFEGLESDEVIVDEKVEDITLESDEESTDEKPEVSNESDESESSDEPNESEDSDEKKEEGHFPQNNVPEPEKAEGGHFKDELSKYITAFGKVEGLDYFMAEKDFATAQSEHIVKLQAENKRLQDAVKLQSETEESPLSGSNELSKPRNGLASRISV